MQVYLQMDIIKQEIEASLLRLAEQYPVVTITSPRQSGKITLYKRVFYENLLRGHF